MSLLKKFGNMFRQVADDAEKALSDTERDSKFAIEDAKNEVAKFTEQIRTVRGHIAKMERQAKELEGKATQMQTVAEAAAKAGNEADVSTALTERSGLVKQQEVLISEIANTREQYEKLLAMKRSREAKIRSADANRGILIARSTSAKIRTSTNEAAAGFGSTDALSALDALASEVDAQEDEAIATEELASLSSVPESLSEKYADAGSADVSDEVAALMASAKK